MFKQDVLIKIKGGIHTRAAAMLVNSASIIKKNFRVNLYVKSVAAREPIAISMLALVSLKIKENEIIEVSCMEDSENGKNAVLAFIKYIEELQKSSDISNIDKIIEENTIAYEQIVKNIPVGVLVVDINSNITAMNEYALKIIDKKSDEVMGRPVINIIPNSLLPDVMKSREKQIGQTQYMNGKIVITNRSPITADGKTIGAVALFQDISELIGMKELNEKFKKILEASHDLICFVDENRKISYVNPAYEEQFLVKSSELSGKDLEEISPNGLRMQVFNSKEPLLNMVYQKDGVDIVTNLQPIFIDNNFKGVISISKAVNEIKGLMRKLEESEEKIKYYKNELKRQNEFENSFSNIIGYSSSLKECLSIAFKASNSTSNVLIRGESGTGKELIAKAIHSNSERKDKPFIRVNCAAIPENLLESELFGYEKGAFTGAYKAKPGKFNLANDGTIFLDEIGDLPISMQVKLLRVIQEREFESVGGLSTQKVDVRIIAATNRKLEAMMQQGEFREDLYYRLNVINILLPPLRNRKEDIPLLVEYFIRKINIKLNKNVNNIDSSCLKYLQNYEWPGNIRELENIIERAINMCSNRTIIAPDLPFYITNAAKKDGSLINLRNGELETIEAYEKEIISLAMKKYKSFNKAAKALGVTHRTVSLKCKKYNIE